MLSFRYHLVSLVAVFLALGIGVIMGSAVIDQATVQVLEDQQDDLRARIDDVQGENDRLEEEIDRRNERDAQLAEEIPVTVADRLDGVPVLTVATRGIDEESVGAVGRVLVDASAVPQGTLWLTDRFVLDDDDEARDLAAALDLDASDSPDELRDVALSRLARALGAAAETPSEDAPEGTAAGSVTLAEPVPALLAAGFLDYDAPEGVSGDGGPSLAVGSRALVLSDADADVADDDLALPLARRLANQLPVLVAAPAFTSDGERVEGSLAELVRDDEALARLVSTVDNPDRVEGRLAVVYALADLGDARVGHYGTLDSAARLLPLSPPPS